MNTHYRDDVEARFDAYRDAQKAGSRALDTAFAVEGAQVQHYATGLFLAERTCDEQLFASSLRDLRREARAMRYTDALRPLRTAAVQAALAAHCALMVDRGVYVN